MTLFAKVRGLMGPALALHVLAAVIWVGGMFFAYMCLRPATTGLDMPVRLRLWAGVLSRFFRFVWMSAAVLLVTGFWMFFNGARGLHVFIMLGLGVVMMLLAAHVYFAPYKKLKRFVGMSNWPEAAKQMNQIRLFIAVNLALGLVLVAIAAGGRYGFN